MNQLLTTKLFIPRTRPNAVARPHLTARLEAGRDGKLTLVSAPAGFGKTTLITQWMGQITDAECCWLSLDAQDSTFSRFVTYLIAALQTVDEQLGASLLPMLQNPSRPSVDEVMTTLINELMGYAKQQLILVLDDYHLMSERAIHTALTFLLTHMPPTLHLVLITRADPPIPLYRWRVRGQMTEIRASDLRFSKSEADLFFNQFMQISLSPEEVDTLEARTEGWIASLQLAGLAMQSLPARSSSTFVTSFAGSDRYVADYLVGEVLQQQPPQIKRFLLQTALLSRLCASLCDYVREGEGSQATLEQLDAANLFVVPLDHERRWYRYHHLFADLLRHRLQQSEPELAPVLHRRASEWYEQNGFVEEAISHALSANAYLRAAQLIEQDAHALFSQGKMESLHRWMSDLPSDFMHSRPHLYLLQGWLLFRTGQFEALERHLQRPLPTDQTLLTDLMRGEWRLLQAHVTFIHGDFDCCIQLVQQAMTFIPSDDLSLRMPAISLQAWSHEAQNDLSAAMACNFQVVKMAQQANSITGLMATLGKLVQLYALQGHELQASVTFEEALQVAETHNSSHLPLLGLAYIGMGRLLYQQRKWDAAKAHLQEGIERCRRWGGLNTEAFKGYLLLAQLWQTQGNEKKAQRILAEARQYGQQHHIPTWAMRLAPPPLLTPIPTQSPLIDPLTQREQEILHLMAQGLSSPKIAEQLVVSVSTIRTHIKHIYSKLDAHSRHEAISQARKLGLL